jgi:hypothetical protein
MTTSFYADDAAIERIGLGLLDRSLPKAEWTHAAHFAAALWLLRHRLDLDLVREMPGLIRAYNVAAGGVNSDTAGYHETITQASLRAARAFLAEHRDQPLHAVVGALMASPLGQPDWLLAYWRRERLMSTQARRAWREPDLQPLPF